MASILVESMKRLYQSGKITKADYEYITGETYRE